MHPRCIYVTLAPPLHLCNTCFSYELSKSIFTGDAHYLRVLRFPQEYKDLLATVHLLADLYPNQPPIYHAWDTKGCGLGMEDVKGRCVCGGGGGVCVCVCVCVYVTSRAGVSSRGWLCCRSRRRRHCRCVYVCVCVYVYMFVCVYACMSVYMRV